MKKLALATAAVLALLSIAGCAQYVGKGKAPPPVVTKGYVLYSTVWGKGRPCAGPFLFPAYLFVWAALAAIWPAYL